MSKKEFTDAELSEIIRSISQPSFNYTVKRFVKQLSECKGMSLNGVLTVLTGVMATTDANLLRWAESLYLAETGKNLDIEKLKSVFQINLAGQLKNSEKLH